MTDKYKCDNCGTTFNVNSDVIYQSFLVKVISLGCPLCKSNEISLTEHGKLLKERAEKLKKLNNEKVG